MLILDIGKESSDSTFTTASTDCFVSGNAPSDTILEEVSLYANTCYDDKQESMAAQHGFPKSSHGSCSILL